MQGSSHWSFTAVRDAPHGLHHPLKCIDCALYSVNYDAGFFNELQGISPQVLLL